MQRLTCSFIAMTPCLGLNQLVQGLHLGSLYGPTQRDLSRSSVPESLRMSTSWLVRSQLVRSLHQLDLWFIEVRKLHGLPYLLSSGTQSWARDNTAATMWPWYLATKLMVILHYYFTRCGYSTVDTATLNFFEFFFSLIYYYIVAKQYNFRFPRSGVTGMLLSVMQIRLNYYTDPDLGSGNPPCKSGSRPGSGSKEKPH